MKTISIINLKGGVGKTISTINIAHVLAHDYNKQVLLIDNDKQGNLTQFFNLEERAKIGIAELLINPDLDADSVINSTNIKNIDIITANMNLIDAGTSLLMEREREQLNILKEKLAPIEGEYDYCIIDNPPDINLTVFNALVASHDVLVPVKIDNFAFKGMELITDIINQARAYNQELTLKGCFVTMYQREKACIQGYEWLQNESGFPVFKTYIRKAAAVNNTTYNGRPILAYDKRSKAAEDYKALVKEYLAK